MSRTLQAAEELSPEGGGGFNPRINPPESTSALAAEGRLSPSPTTTPSHSAASLAPEGSSQPDILSISAQLDIHPGDAAVLATHSYEQDTHILAFLLGRAPHQRPAYIGILGPQRRTREALAEAARLLGLVPTTRLVDLWLEEIHGPTGLDLGADTPASIALSILAEIQKSLNAATALPLKQVRAVHQIHA
jgi:xanthine/CO dehydrogenase XdhC/CoxF family maturation factor